MKGSVLSKLVWFAVAIAGAWAVGSIATHRGESINAIWFVVAAACVYLIAFRFYSAWICAKVLVLDETRATPRSASTTGATSSRPTSGWCSATTSPPSPGRAP